MKKRNKLHQSTFYKTALTALCSILLSACVSTDPTMGSASGHTVTGGAGGASAEGNNDALHRCEAPLGTLSVFEDKSLTWWQDYRGRYPKLGSTVPVIRLMIQQSNCFVVVERGRAMAAMNSERALMQSGQLRSGSNIGGGQMVAADYTISPEIQFAQKGTSGAKAIGGALFGSLGALVGGGFSNNEASTTLILIDNRSGVQLSASVGNAENTDYTFLGGMFAGFMGGGAGGFSDTPEGKIISAAFADSYNKMVLSLKKYKAQEVKGGLGNGGALKVSGTPQATSAQPIPVAAIHTNPKPIPVRVSHNRNTNFEVDEYDEDALNDYYNTLKQTSSSFSGLASYTSTSNSETKNMIVMALNMMSSQIEGHKIELESWPQDAKVEGWRVLGNKIEKYNTLFEKNKNLALKQEDLDENIKSILLGIDLVTRQSLIGS